MTAQNILKMARVHPSTKIAGTVQPPGDKSISHRIGLLASVATGISTVQGFLQSGDCIALLKAMEALGARTHFDRDGELYIQGTSGKIMTPSGALDMGNSGTAMRLLTGFLSGRNIVAELTGDESLRSRPMKRVQDPLALMGAHIELLGPNGCAPIRVTGSHLKGITYEVPMASAQVKSAILLAGLYAEGDTSVIEPEHTRDHTERIFQTLDLPLTMEDKTITITGAGPQGPKIIGRKWSVPSDFSSASFWIVAAAAHRRGSITLKNVGLNPRRTALLDVLKRMGARIKVIPSKSSLSAEPVGEIRVAGGKLQGTVIGGTEIPNLIDEIPILSVAAALADGETIVKDAKELRHKESDRIKTMCENLSRNGVDVEEREDGMVVHGPGKVKSAGMVDSYGDHRVAMSMAVLALFADKPLIVRNIECVETSYPGFWEDLQRLGGHVEY